MSEHIGNHEIASVDEVHIVRDQPTITPFSTLYGRYVITHHMMRSLSPRQMVELDRAADKFIRKHPEMIVLSDNASEPTAHRVIVWMHRDMWEEFRTRVQKDRSYNTKLYFAELDERGIDNALVRVPVSGERGQLEGPSDSGED